MRFNSKLNYLADGCRNVWAVQSAFPKNYNLWSLDCASVLINYATHTRMSKGRSWTSIKRTFMQLLNAVAEHWDRFQKGDWIVSCWLIAKEFSRDFVMSCGFILMTANKLIVADKEIWNQRRSLWLSLEKPQTIIVEATDDRWRYFLQLQKHF